MKYLILNLYPPVAIPLDALAAASEMIFLDSEYDDKGEKVYWRKDKQLIEGRIIDSSEILPEEPGKEAAPVEPAPEEPF